MRLTRTLTGMRALILLLLLAHTLMAADAPPVVENRPADGYRGIWYAIGKKPPKYGGGLGTYPANMVPMASYDAVADTTWFVYGGTSAAGDRDLQIMIGAWRHADGTVERPTTIRDSGGFEDAHANPAMCVGGDGHLYVVSATRHAFEGRIYRSLRPHDHSAFEVVHRGYMAYPQLWYHERTGYVLLHTRYVGGQRHLFSMRSADGRSWDAPIGYAAFNGHYQNSALLADGRIVTVFNHHPGGVDQRTNIYAMATADGGRNWQDLRGGRIELPLGAPANSALVLDAAARKELVYIMDLAIDSDGTPVVLYLTARSIQIGPGGGPRTWRTLQLGAKGWSERTITTSTHNYDCGTLCIDGRTWTVIGPTSPGPQAQHTGGEMVLWTSIDQGQDWRSRPLTAGSPRNHSYARRPVPRHPGFVAFWADGDSTAPSASDLFVADAKGTVYRLPRTMTAARQAPEVLRRGR